MPKTSIWRSRVGTELMLGKIVEVSNIGIERIPCAKVFIIIILKLKMSSGPL